MYPFIYSFFNSSCFKHRFSAPTRAGWEWNSLLHQIWNFEGYLYNKHFYRNTHTLSTLPPVLANAKQCSNDVEKRKLKLCNIACKWQALIGPCIYIEENNPLDIQIPNDVRCLGMFGVWFFVGLFHTSNPQVFGCLAIRIYYSLQMDLQPCSCDPQTWSSLEHFLNPTVDGRNPAPLRMYKPLQ